MVWNLHYIVKNQSNKYHISDMSTSTKTNHLSNFSSEEKQRKRLKKWNYYLSSRYKFLEKVVVIVQVNLFVAY